MRDQKFKQGEVRPSGYVQYWDLKNLSYSFLEQRAAERDIEPNNVSNATLQAILALWEYDLPRDDPMRSSLVTMMGMSAEQMKDLVDVAGYWTKRDMVHRYITAEVKRREALAAEGGKDSA
ncbi:hypothetical protein PG984_006949 [Apiospora sp. TS-2023a]